MNVGITYHFSSRCYCTSHRNRKILQEIDKSIDFVLCYDASIIERKSSSMLRNRYSRRLQRNHLKTYLSSLRAPERCNN